MNYFLPSRIKRCLFFFLTYCLLPACLFSQGTWTQKPNFGGSARIGAIGFSIGTKGYFGTGYDVTNKQDFWEWDQTTNVWTQKANFLGNARHDAVGFSIGTKGYIGTGNGGTLASYNTVYVDFWEWDQTTNVWTQKANFGGTAREWANAFSIGTKGYIGVGEESNQSLLQDFWEWDQATNTWTQIAPFPRSRWDPFGFVIGSKAYLGMGWNYQSGWVNDTWEYDPSTNVWTQKANFPGNGGRMGASEFTIGNCGFVGIGDSLYGGIKLSDFYKYDPALNTWSAIASFGGGIRAYAASFSIGCFGYVGTGIKSNGSYSNDFWEYEDFSANTVGPSTICAGQSVTITGYGGNTYAWSTGGTSSAIIVSPTVTTSYSVTGIFGSCVHTASVTVTITPAPIPAISGNNTICSGHSTMLNANGGNSYVWNTSAITSSIIISPTITTNYSVAISIGACTRDTSITVTVNLSPTTTITGNKSLCSGNNTTLSGFGTGNYSWSTGETTNPIIVAPTSTNSYSVTLSDVNGCTAVSSTTVNVTHTPVAVISNNTTICQGDSIILSGSGGGKYRWNTGETTSSIYVNPNTSTNYSVVVSNGNCTDTASTFITVNPNPIVNISGTSNIFQGQSVTLTASGSGSYLWNTGDTTITILVTPNITTLYCVTVNLNNCTDSICVNVFVESPCDTAGIFFFPNAFSPNGDGDNDYLKVYYKEMNCIATLHLVIYDRWGEQIFETTDKNFSWDGTHLNKILNTQVLAYHLTVGFTDGKAINRKGNICLAR